MQEINHKVEKAQVAVEKNPAAALSAGAWKQLEEAQANRPNVKVEEGHALVMTDPYEAVQKCGPINLPRGFAGGGRVGESGELIDGHNQPALKDSGDLKKIPEPGEKLPKENSSIKSDPDAAASESRLKTPKPYDAATPELKAPGGKSNQPELTGAVKKC